MIDFLKEYCTIISYALIGLVFAFASFFLLVNLYHASDVSRVVSVDLDGNSTMQSIKDSLNRIETNLAEFDINHYHGNLTSFQMMTAENKLQNCAAALNNETFQKLFAKNEISIVDVYEFREAYENEVVGKCVIESLSWFTRASEENIADEYLQANEKILSLYLDSMKTDTSYLKKDLLNNSSYYFNTALATSTVHDKVRDGYYDVLSAYRNVVEVVEELSHWFYEETREVAQ